MSSFATDFDDCQERTAVHPKVHAIIAPRERDLGGFFVRRCLPSTQVPMIGPFIFFDHLGPVTFAPGKGVDVRPHPHIHLATVTYLFAGEILHRDSLGSVQPITPGAINWMTAGRGIVHSERTPPQIRAHEHGLHALQLWVALPEDHESTEPDFHHYPAQDIPETTIEQVRIRVLVGDAWGLSSPVRTLSPTLFCELQLPAGTRLTLPNHLTERGLYLVSGSLHIDNCQLAAQTMTCLTAGMDVVLEAIDDAHCILIGGEPLGKRHIWWNFVSSSQGAIEQAKSDWCNGRFPAVPDDPEFIPLPEK